MTRKIKKYTGEPISEVEKKILEERGLLKHVEWIRSKFIKMKLMMLIILLSTLITPGLLIFKESEEEKIQITYVFTPNRMILIGTSYLMKIADQKTLDELKILPSIYRKERLALDTYLEHTSSGILIANTKESLNYKFEKLEDYEGTIKVILGFSFKAEKKAISKPILCEFIENEIILRIIMKSSSIPDKEKKLLNIGTCIIKVPNDPMYTIYPKKRFESGAFNFMD